MTIVPNGTVTLYQSVNLQSNYNITYWFDTRERQTNFFDSFLKIDLFPNGSPEYRGKFSYIRKNKNTIKVECNMNKLLNCNYMSFKNTGVNNTEIFENKTYYCFVTDLRYINNTTTEIEYQIDLIQTYLFDIEFRQSYVLRQHSETDNLYENLQPEEVSLGEYISENFSPFIPRLAPDNVLFTTDFSVVIMYNTKILSNEALKLALGDTAYNAMHRSKNGYSGIYQGCDYLFIPYTKDVINTLDQLIFGLEGVTLGGIINIFMCPSFAIPVVFDEQTETNEQFIGRQNNHVINTWKLNGTNTNITRKENSFSGYTPINKKLYTYPYCYLYATNFRGTQEIYKYEYFTYGENSNIIVFNVEGNFSPSPSLILIPTLYKHTSISDDNMSIDVIPTCSWSKNDIVDWLAKAAMVSVGAYTGGNGGLSIGVTGGAGGGLVSAHKENKTIPYYKGMEVSNSTAKVMGRNDEEIRKRFHEQGWDEYFTPDVEYKDEVRTIFDRSGFYAKGNLAIGEHTMGVAQTDILFGNETTQTFGIYKMEIKREFAERADAFFSRYGYAQNKFDVLSLSKLHNRRNWTYIQTENCYLHVNNAQHKIEDALEKIFDKGITFWAYNSNDGSGNSVAFGDFSHPEYNIPLGGV